MLFLEYMLLPSVKVFQAMTMQDFINGGCTTLLTDAPTHSPVSMLLSWASVESFTPKFVHSLRTRLSVKYGVVKN